MNETHASMLSVSNRSKLREPPGKCWTVRLSMESRRRPSVSSERPMPRDGGSRTRGVKAPFFPVGGGVVESDDFVGTSSLVGDSERGVDILLTVDEPRVAAMDGDAGGPGDRVK